jgi:hypothetical protein
MGKEEFTINLIGLFPELNFKPLWVEYCTDVPPPPPTVLPAYSNVKSKGRLLMSDTYTWSIL